MDDERARQMHRSGKSKIRTIAISRLRGLLPVFFILGSAGIATTQSVSNRPYGVETPNRTVSKNGTSPVYPVSTPTAGKTASHYATNLGAEVQRIEHQKAARTKGNQVPPVVGASRRSAPRNPSIDFRFQSNNQRGRINNLGNGSGSVRSGAGLRISEKRH